MVSRLSAALCLPKLDTAPTPLLYSYAKRYNQQAFSVPAVGGEVLKGDVQELFVDVERITM